MIARLLGLLLMLCAGSATASATGTAGPPPRILVMLRLAPPHFRGGTGYGGGYGEDQSLGGRRRIASRIAHRHGLELAGNWPMPSIGIDCFIMAVPAGRTAAAAAAEVSNDPGVAWSQPVATFKALASGDPLFAAQPTAQAWRLEALHNVATGRKVRVAVIDSQVDAGHPDLAGQIAISRDFAGQPPSRGEMHGTGVAGVIAAKAGNGIGIAGVAPAARLLALRACWQSSAETVCDTLSLARAITFAVEQRADILNLSLGGPPDRLLATLLRAAVARGLHVVAAYDSTQPGGGFPASLGGVIAVAGRPIGSVGPPYSAPGRDIPATQPGGRWYLVSGASYAAAQVSGLLALMRERQDDVRARPRLISARRGGGEIDACATVVGPSAACANASIASNAVH